MWFVHIHSQMTTTEKTKKTTSKSFFLKDLPCSSWLYIWYNITDYHINNYQINFIKLNKKNKFQAAVCLQSVEDKLKSWSIVLMVNCTEPYLTAGPEEDLLLNLSGRWNPSNILLVAAVKALTAHYEKSHANISVCVWESEREREADRQPDRDRENRYK